ncbi:hypothetical protein HDA40_007630 [Hamadaea flava]|uniref:Uncharacterized protein n=1 Tax=Hamadaea flava TaxID=1742688 RepID=A0ABV8LVJ1_9ACTN|nr:hypothetical protein [Hamadaea flava]MCP2329123.1 hypothetical protein [Hamadaea flava]
MIHWLCEGLLDGAAAKWPADRRAEMLAEWRAELQAAPGRWARLRYAASLATSPAPDRPAIGLGRAIGGILGSLIVLLVTPILYLFLAGLWAHRIADDTVGWQWWAAAGSLVGAVLAGRLCARLSRSVARVIGPWGTIPWTFGLAFLGLLGVIAAIDGVRETELVDLLLWALGGTCFLGISAALAVRGRRVLSWTFTALGVPGAIALFTTHAALFLPLADEDIFGGHLLLIYLFEFVTSPVVHVTVFLMVYGQTLVVAAWDAPRNGVTLSA